MQPTIWSYIFFGLTNWRKVRYKRTYGEEDEYMINDCDEFIIVGDTLSRGGHVHVFNNTSLTRLINYYNYERENNGYVKIINNIIHTNNYPAQYKCRQNFWYIDVNPKAIGEARLIQKFAQKYIFKGSWDATVKLVKSTILKNEFKLDKCTDAYDFYLILNRDLTKGGQ